MATAPRSSRPWTFVPGLYVLQGMPYFAVQAGANTFLAAMGTSTAVVGHWTAIVTLPWTLKPLWSPLVDLYGTKRRWLFAAACAVLVAMIGLAFATDRPAYVEWTVAACLVLAVASATYDIACDGYYMLALEKRQQEAFVGVRNTCYRLGRILISGGVVALAGLLQDEPGEHLLARGLERGSAWGLAFGAGAAVYGVGAITVALFAPRPAADTAVRAPGDRIPLADMLREYVVRPRFAAILAFIVFYRCAESMLGPMISPFLLAARADGGLELGEKHVGWIYGTIGVIALLAGGIAGGWLISRRGLTSLLWPMALAMHAPNLLYAWAAHAQPGPAGAAVVVAVEMLGYGFGFSAYMVFLLQLARASRFATTHYAISTGVMGLAAMVASYWSGDLVGRLGYERFFWLVSALGLVGLATLFFVPRLEAPHATAT